MFYLSLSLYEGGDVCTMLPFFTFIIGENEKTGRTKISIEVEMPQKKAVIILINLLVWLGFYLPGIKEFFLQ